MKSELRPIPETQMLSILREDRDKWSKFATLKMTPLMVWNLPL